MKTIIAKRPALNRAGKAKIGGVVAAVAMGAQVLAGCPTPESNNTPTPTPPAPQIPTKEEVLREASEWLEKPERKIAPKSNPNNKYDFNIENSGNELIYNTIKENYIHDVESEYDNEATPFLPTIEQKLEQTGTIVSSDFRVIVSKATTGIKVYGA